MRKKAGKLRILVCNYPKPAIPDPMLDQSTEKKLIEIFMACDDFCLALQTWQAKTHLAGVAQPRVLGAGTPGPARQLADSEALCLVIFYHYSGYKCFEYYYQRLVLAQLRPYFPGLVSYERFVALLPRLLPGFWVLTHWLVSQSQRTGQYFADSKKLVVCHNARIHSNRVFTGVASRGKSSTGWFYGLKLHLVINELGEVVNFVVTPGNQADNNARVLRALLGGLQGQCYADRGYLSKLFAEFYQQGLHLITRLRKGMKGAILPYVQAIKLRKRALIESVNDLLTSVFDLEHSRHRSPVNAFVHLLGGLCAYCFYDHKPAVFLPNFVLQ